MYRSSSLSRSSEYSTFFNRTFLADYIVELREGSDGAPTPASSTHSLPAHALILCRSSPLLKELIEIDVEGGGDSGR